MLPPPSRRGLVLIDPSYEDKADYKRTKQALVDALERFATGTYAIWYPQVQRRESRQLPNSLKLAGASDWLHVSLTVKAPAADGSDTATSRPSPSITCERPGWVPW